MTRYGMTLALVVAFPWSLCAGQWTLAERELPPSPHVSPELQKVLQESPAPDAVSAKRDFPPTVDVWKAVIAAADAAGAQRARASAGQLGVSVEEDKLAGVRVYRLQPKTIAPEHAEHLFVYIHGGAFIFGGGLAGTAEAVLIAERLGIPVVSIDYRLAPEHPAPAAMEDVVGVWTELTKSRPASAMALGGTSAGGTLALVATLRMKELNLPLPAALYVGTPGADVTNNGDSRHINEGVDRTLVAWEGRIAEAVALYVAGNRADDPHISPIHANVEGFPPTYLISGTRDLLLSDTVVMHRKLRRAGVPADLHIYEGQSHADYALLPELSESAEHYRELKVFVLKWLVESK